MAIKLIIRRRGAAPDAPPLAEQDFDDPIVTIGSHGAAVLHLDDPSVAPEQATIHNKDGSIFFINHASGTCLNGEPLSCGARHPLAHGDRLDIGEYLIRIYPCHGARASSFAGILDDLRTEEDSFHFEIVNSAGGHQRVIIEDAESLIGWDETGRQVSCDAASVRAPRARVRKDWGGVVVQPHGPGTVEVNGEPVGAARRLLDGDRLTLLPTAVAADQRETVLVFREPAVLLALGSLLPQQLPPPVAPGPSVAAAEAKQEPPIPQVLEPMPEAGPRPVSPRQSYFGYFTLGEVVILILGTLAAAVVIFMAMAFLMR